MLTALLPLLILVGLCLMLPPLGAVLGRQPVGESPHLPLIGRTADALPADLTIFTACGALLLAIGFQLVRSVPTLFSGVAHGD